MANQQIEKLLIEKAAEFRHDPYGYVQFAFKNPDDPDAPVKCHDWQKDLLQSIGEQLRKGEKTVHEAILEAIASGHGIGKSCVVAWLIFWCMGTCVDAKGVVTANTENQLKTKTWAEVSKWYSLWRYKHWFTLTATCIYSNIPDKEKTWRFDMIPWSERTQEAFAGLHNKGKRILLIFDEASAIPNAIWTTSEGALTDENTEIIWAVFGNPTRNTGDFRECFRKKRHRWNRRYIDSRDVPGTNKEQIEKWIEDYGIDSDFVKIRVRGMFPSQSAKQFIPVEIVDAAASVILRKEQFDFAPVIITCDPAWEGDDFTVIGKRQGLHYERLRKIQKNNNDVHIAGIIANYEDQYKASAVFIDLGFGTGIVSAGRTMGRNWQGVWFSWASADPGCLNKRTEMWNSMLQWMKEGGSIGDNRDLYDDLISPELVPRPDGKKQLESKKSMKSRGLPSPDEADALALSFAMPVREISNGIASGMPKARNTNYKPLDYYTRRK